MAEARAIGEGKDGWAKHAAVFFRKLEEHGLRDHLLHTIGLWGGPEPSFNAFVRGNVDATFALAKDWGRTYKQDSVAVLIPDRRGTGGISRWTFDRDLTNDELDNLLGAMATINTRQKQIAIRGGIEPVEIGLTVKSNREVEYWYGDMKDRRAVSLLLEEAMTMSGLSPSQRWWGGGYRREFLMGNVDYPIEE